MHLFLQLLLLVLIPPFFLLIQKSRKNGRKPNQPPGPPGLPVIGNLHQFVSSYPHLYFHELSKNYGPIMSLKLGSVPTLVISSAKMAKEVMKTHDQIFCSRPPLATQQKLSYDGSDVVFTPYGDCWKNLRKVCMIHLFSSSKVQSFSPIREEEVYRMTQKISRLSAENWPVDLSEIMSCLASTVICRAAFGRRYDGDNGRSGSSFEDLLRETQEMFMSFCFSDYFPFMGWVDKLTGMSARLHRVFMELDCFYEEVIDEHLKRNRPESGEEDIVDVLLKLRKEDSLGVDITLDHIKALLMNIFVAGTDTSAATVVWAMTELMKNPDAMKRVQEEARALMRNKTSKMIKEEDLEKLVYLKGVVKETLRFAALVLEETHKHLFFQCIVSKLIVKEIANWINFSLCNYDAHRMANCILRRRPGRKFCRLVQVTAFAALVYHVWRARNQAWHDKFIKKTSMIINDVKRDVTGRISFLLPSNIASKDKIWLDKL